MRRIRLPFLAAAALSTSFVTTPAHAKPPITFTGSFTGTIVTQTPGSCGPNQVDVNATFSGLFSPFGTATGTQAACVNLGTFDFTGGVFTLDFGGGNTLFGTSAGSFVMTAPQVFSGSSTIVINGGTGMFTEATGTGTTHGTQNLAAGTVAFDATGTIAGPQLNAVPEPASLALLAGGLGLMAAIGRRRGRAD